MIEATDPVRFLPWGAAASSYRTIWGGMGGAFPEIWLSDLRHSSIFWINGHRCRVSHFLKCMTGIRFPEICDAAASPVDRLELADATDAGQLAGSPVRDRVMHFARRNPISEGRSR